MRSFSFVSSIVVSLLVASSALAQGGAPATPVATPSPSPAPPPQNAPATSAPNDMATLPLPTVNDPMLAAVPAAKKEISTWQEALALVRARSTDLRTSYDQVLEAEAQERIALAAILPSLSGTLTGTHNFITKDTVLFSGTVKNPIAQTFTSPIPSYGAGNIQLQQTILNLQQFYAIGTAREGTHGAKLSYEDMKRTIALSVANDIVGVITAERVAEINREGLRQSLERLDLTERKMRLGAATGLDVVRAQQDVESARTTLVSGDETLRKARESLGLAVGVPTEVGVAGNIQIDGLERDAVSQCRAADSIDARADIRSLASKAVVQDRLIEDAWLQFAPTINAQSNISTSSVTNPSSPQTTWNIQGVLSWNIWDGGVRYGNLRNTRAQYDQALQALEAARRNALVQVEQAQRDVTVATDTLTVQKRARDLAIKNDELTQASYRGGTLTSLDLVTAATSRRQAEIQYALDEFNLVQARVGAILALATCEW